MLQGRQFAWMQKQITFCRILNVYVHMATSDLVSQNGVSSVNIERVFNIKIVPIYCKSFNRNILVEVEVGVSMLFPETE